MQNKKVLFIFGPSAVGKMTVGQELTKMTDLRLYHNHLTIESILPIFDFGTNEFKKLVDEFRTRIFEEVASSDIPGIIFTFVWDLNYEAGHRQIRQWIQIFKQKGAFLFFAELEATLEERIKRNKTENRLLNKPSKRDIEKSESIILSVESNLKLNTTDDFPYKEPYLKINNTNLTASEVAFLIKTEFNL